MMGVAALYASPSGLPRLVCASLGAVVLAATLYLAWVRTAELDEEGGAVRAVAAA